MPRSPNVVTCKECGREFGEEDGTFRADKKKGGGWFKVKHKGCGNTFSVHHREFYKRGGVSPTKNPFDPVRISVSDW